MTAEFRARYAKLFDNTYETAYGHYPANADPTATPPHNGWTGLASLNTAHTGLPFITRLHATDEQPRGVMLAYSAYDTFADTAVQDSLAGAGLTVY